MTYLLEEIPIPYLEDSPEELLARVRKLTGRSIGPADLLIWRRSLDARAKNNIHYCYAVVVEMPGRALAKEIDIRESPIPQIHGAPPLVIGFGPAGIFAAYYLAKAGLKPIVIERGPSMRERVEAVTSFWNARFWDEECHVQFGEGGAGTFSDGKLTSRSKDPASRTIRRILAEHGAAADVLYQAKPHIGTDRLQAIIPSLREEIVRLGGEVRFRERVERLCIRDERVTGVRLASGEELNAPAVFLGIGHSARDTFSMLRELGVTLEPKPFAVGVRVEHRQDVISEAIYGRRADWSRLPTAEYSLSHHVGERGCYSFCMCPGGQVVNASSESGGVTVNGMSLSGRDGEFANAALVAGVSVADFFQGNPLDGVEFQRGIERAAARAAGNGAAPYLAPASDLRCFLSGEKPPGVRRSSFTGGLVSVDLGGLFPRFVVEALRGSVDHFERSLRGFSSSNPLLIAPETRTSSPVRICRHPDSRQSVSHAGLFPVGEGAGYAGGIVSAAIDGWRSAEKYVEELLLGDARPNS